MGSGSVGSGSVLTFSRGPTVPILGAGRDRLRSSHTAQKGRLPPPGGGGCGGSFDPVLSATEADGDSAGDREEGTHLDIQRGQGGAGDRLEGRARPAKTSLWTQMGEAPGRGRGGGRFLMVSRNWRVKVAPASNQPILSSPPSACPSSSCAEPLPHPRGPN